MNIDKYQEQNLLINVLRAKGGKPTPLGVGWIAKSLDMSLTLSLM